MSLIARYNGQSVFGNACNTVASLTKNFSAFATPLQVSRKTFWRLRESRKSLEKLFGVCGSPASLSENFLVFAGAPQVSREIFWRLRESRKSLGKFFGVCGSPASLSRNFLAFAGVPQVSRKTFWRLRDSRKHLQSRGPSGRRTEMRFRAFHTEIKRLYLCQRF